jgi:aminoglycoside phosphotransferase (APT) family kinase protein
MSTPRGIDVDQVTSWLEEHVAHAWGPFEFEAVTEGHSNLTVRVTGVDGARFVLRRPPTGEVLATAHDMGREHRILSALRPTPVPVPEMLGYCGDREVTGAPFYVMRHVDGVILHELDDALEGLDRDARRVAGLRLAEVLADLHAVAPEDVGLGDLGRREDYVARQLRRWTRQYEAGTLELPGFREVHAALSQAIPPQGPATIVHGDYRHGNVVHEPTGEVAAVLDWEVCTLGDPLADLGYLLLMWPKGDDAERWIGSAAAADGFPTAQELLDRYAERSGRDVSRIDFYVTFAMWRIAAILAGVYSRYVGGVMGEVPDGVEHFAEQALGYARRAHERVAPGGGRGGTE